MINDNDKLQSAYFVSHLGLGDNITMSSAVRYLTHFYTKIYVIVKQKYLYNMKLWYEDNPNIILVSIDENNEVHEIKNIINHLDQNIDVFISGFCHTTYCQSRIRHPILNNTIANNNNVIFDYNFVIGFYTDINLNFNIYYDYFYIHENPKSLELFNQISNYKIIFVHSQSSTKEVSINLDNYIHNNEFIIICANKNYYNNNHNQFNIANNFVNLPIIYYSKIIKNASIIKVVDSCFSCIIMPLKYNKKLSTDDITIFKR